MGKRDFTDRYLKSIKPAEKGRRVIEWDGVVPQFGIRIDDKSCSENVGAFVLVTRFPGKSNPAPRRIGFYSSLKPSKADDTAPVGGRMSLARARQIAREWRDDIKAGVDPKDKAAELQRKEVRKKADTFAAAFADYADEHLSKLRTGEAVKMSIARHVLPKFGATPMREIRRGDVRDLIKGILKTAPIASNRVLAYLKMFFRWAEEEELIDASPVATLKRKGIEVKRDRTLTDSEIKAVWLAAGELGAFGRAFRFLLATGQRRSEVGELPWREVDQTARLWTLPRERSKADRSHEIPLSGLAMSILGECPRVGDYVFTARGTRPVSGWSKAKLALDRLALERLKEIAAERGDDIPAEMSPWHVHDLRRTCATNLAKLGVDRVVISKVLNHAEGGVTQIYDRHARDPEKRAAMDHWAQRLRAIIDGTDGGNVVSITSARA